MAVAVAAGAGKRRAAPTNNVCLRGCNVSIHFGDAYLEGHVEIGREAAAVLLGLKPVQASTILSTLYHDNRVIEPVGKPRGRGVRYRLTVTR